jgi:hypothetical protein
MKTKRKKTLRIVIIIAFIVVLFGGFYIYTLNYYRADASAAAVMAATDITIEAKSGTTVFYPSSANSINTGFIFYPGGKVEDVAYAPLLKQLAEKGLTCVLVKMPFNLAVFNINAADSVYKQVPEIKTWYIGGHSLGGVMASSYTWKGSSKLSGLILLGAYPINSSSLPTLVVYGSEDKNLDKKKFDGVKDVVEIMGGNHAQFGNYGKQYGDGTATITREAQQAQAVDAIMAFIINTNK